MDELNEVPNEVAAGGFPDRESSAEQNRTQVEAAIKFAKYITTRYPQVDDSPTTVMEIGSGVHIEVPEASKGLQPLSLLNYYLAGSLATTLLSRAESIDLCTETNISGITVERTLANSTQTQAALAEFARPIGDLDYVQTVHYESQKELVQQSYSGDGSDPEYELGRSKYLWKGQGEPKFGDLPPEALPAVMMRTDQTTDEGIYCEPVRDYGTKRFARITVDEQEYYVGRPDTIVAYKILHMMEAFDLKPDKFNSDFPKLYQAMTGLYSEAEIVEVTHHLLEEYEQSMKQSSDPDRYYIAKLPSMTRNLLANPTLGTEARSFINKVVEYDQSHGQIFGAQTGSPSE